LPPVGEEKNGVTLSVLSGLTRLGLDPWEEAARLTPLPKARAAEALAKVIAQLPIHRTQSLDDLAISRGLGELLPAKRIAPLQGWEQSTAQKKYWGTMICSPALLSARQSCPACCDRVPTTSGVAY
jgi:hypothetical protein